MPRNVEVKARVVHFESVARQARRIAGGASPRCLMQVDTFYPAKSGRLKLREFGDETAELIWYRRANEREPKESLFHRVPLRGGEAISELRAILEACYGEPSCVVRKERLLWIVVTPPAEGGTRIHLDRVEGLGDFAELEVVIGPKQDPSDFTAIVSQLMDALGLVKADLVDSAYVDMLKAEIDKQSASAC